MAISTGSKERAKQGQKTHAAVRYTSVLKDYGRKRSGIVSYLKATASHIPYNCSFDRLK